MFRRRPVFWIIAILAILLALLAGWLLSAHAPTATASDGRAVTIENVTYGTDHRFIRGKLWVRLLKPFLGTAWAAQRGCYETRFASTNPVMMVWTRWSGISLTNPLPLEVSIIDEAGTESEFVSARWNQSDWSAGTNRSTYRVAWMLQNYPRRSGRLRMRVYDRDSGYNPRSVVEIAFPNFDPAHHRQWSGRATPISVTNSGVKFTLEEFTNVTSNTWSARFEVRTNGQPDSSWQVGRISAADATGNFVSTLTNIIAGSHRDLTIALERALWPSERAWRISGEFCRAFDFQPHELWTSPNIAIPVVGSSGITNLSLTNVVLGCTLVLSELHANASSVSLRLVGPHVTLIAWFGSASAPSRLFLVEAVDHSGRKITAQQVSTTAVGWHTFSLLLPGDSKTLRFTFAVRRTTSVAFYVANPAPKL